jgi:hypothetical protein
VAGDRLTVSVTAELKEFERRLSMLPEIGGKEAKGLASQIRKELKGAEESAEGSARKIGAALGGATSVIEKGLRVLGPVGNGVADVLYDFVAPLAEAGAGVAEVTGGMGAAGAAATTAGVAVAGVAAAVAAVAIGAGLALAGMFALTNAAIGAADRLEAVGQASRIPEGSQEALDRFQGASNALWQELDVLVVQLGSALAPALTVLVDKVGQVIEWVNNLDKSFDALRRGIDQVVGMLPTWARWEPAISLVKGAVDALEDSYEELKTAAEDVKLAPSQEEVDRWKELARARREAESEEFARRREEALAWVASAIEEEEQLAALQELTTPDKLDAMGWEKQRKDLQDRIDLQDLLIAKILETRIAEQAVTDASISETETRKDLIQKELDYVAQSFDAASSAVDAITGQILEDYAARVDAGEEVTAEETRRAQAALAVQKTMQLASMTASAVATWMSLTRDLATLPGNAPFAAFEAAGIVAATLVAPASQILGQTIPFVNTNPPNPGVYTPENINDYDREELDEALQEGDIKFGRSTGSTARTSGSSVMVSVVFSDGRVGKRRIR